MEPSSNFLERVAFNTRLKIEEHILVVKDEPTQKKQLSQPLQTINKQFKIAATFLTGYNAIFKVTNSINKFYFANSFNDGGFFIQITILSGAYEIESLNSEIERMNIYEGHFTETNYPFQIKPNFSTLGSIIEISEQGPTITFVPNDGIRDPLGFIKTTIYDEYNLSPNPVDILSFVILFLRCDIAQGMRFKGRRNGIIHNWTITVDPGYIYM